MAVARGHRSSAAWCGELPERLQPKIKPEIWAVAFDPDSGAAVAGLRTQHPDFGPVTGLVEAAGKLWMGTIGFPALAHVDLAATQLSASLTGGQPA